MQAAVANRDAPLAHSINRPTDLASRLVSWAIPSLADLLFVGGIVAAISAGRVMISADGDPARHLTVGEHMLATASAPRQDLFSHTMHGMPFVPYEWLAEVASAASYRLAGLAGPVLLHGALIGLTFALVIGHLCRRGAPPLLALAVTLFAGVASAVHWLARPHVFTFVGAACFAAILDDWFSGRRRGATLWLLPPLMVLWANIHGGFLIGLILAGCYVGADGLRWAFGEATVRRQAVARLRVLAPPVLVTVIAPVLSVAGPGLYGHVTGYFEKRLLIDRTVEYMSPSLHDSDVLPFFAMFGATMAALAFSRRRLPLHELLLVASFSYFALFSARNIPLFAIVVAPILCDTVRHLDLSALAQNRLAAAGRRAAAWCARRNTVYARMDSRARGHLWPIVLVVSLTALAAAQVRTGDMPLGITFRDRAQPVHAVDYLVQNPPRGNMFNDMVWGGYLLHRLWPEQRVFIDGQTDFYGEELTREYLLVQSLEAGWQSVLDRYDVDWVINPTNSPLVLRLQEDPAWKVVYSDSYATVVARRDP